MSITYEGQKNKEHDCQLKEALGCLENSPCQHLKKFPESSMQNMHTDDMV